MKRKLKEELVRISTDIITSRDLHNISDMYEAARGLYEKLAVLKFIDERLSDVEVDASKNAMVEKFEKMATAVLEGNSAVPESNPHQEDIIIPGIDTIKDMVSEMPNGNGIDEVLAEFMAQPNYAKNDQELFEPQKKETPIPEFTAPLQGKAAKEIKVDLNDRLAFVKHLFNNSTEDYNRVISQLNTIASEERSIAFIINMVKPDYNNWEGKEQYAARFMGLIERRFS
jgi:hypothetical protein